MELCPQEEKITHRLQIGLHRLGHKLLCLQVYCPDKLPAHQLMLGLSLFWLGIKHYLQHHQFVVGLVQE